MTDMKSPSYAGSGMYRENILDHYKNPRNKGEIDDADLHIHESNPSCGDVIDWYARIEGERLEEVKFSGHGCAISQAAASMLSEGIQGMKLEDVKSMEKDQVFDMLGIELSPMRIKCALLGIKALKKAILLEEGER